MNNSKSNIIGAISKCLAFNFLLTCIYGNTLTEDTFYSGATNINGTEGKAITITYTQKANTTESENYNVQWLKDGKTVDKNDGRYIFNEDKENGKFSLTIYLLQRRDEGRYKIKLGEVISQETVLNIIEIPSSDYPKIELKKVKDQLEVYCISENTSPHPKFSINDEKLSFDINTTHIWAIKRVPITTDMTEEVYTCVLELADYYRRYSTKTGSEITTYLKEIEYENFEKTTIPTDSTNDEQVSKFKNLVIIFGILSVLIITGNALYFIKSKITKSK